MQNIWAVVDLLRQNQRWWFPIISCVYVVNLDSRMLDKILYVIWRKWYASIITTNRYTDRIRPLIRQFLLLPNRISKFMISEWIVLPPGLISSAGILSIPGDLCHFRFSIAVSFSAPVQTYPEAHPASCTMGMGSFPGVRCGRGVTLTPHPLLVPRSKIEYSYTSTLRKDLCGLRKGETYELPSQLKTHLAQALVVLPHVFLSA